MRRPYKIGIDRQMGLAMNSDVLRVCRFDHSNHKAEDRREYGDIFEGKTFRKRQDVKGEGSNMKLGNLIHKHC